jgi:hypothetical protein
MPQYISSLKGSFRREERIAGIMYLKELIGGRVTQDEPNEEKGTVQRAIFRGLNEGWKIKR